MRKIMTWCGLLFALVSLMFLAACGGEGKGPPETPPLSVISGLVVDMLSADTAPVEGATVETEDGSISTVTDENGFWQLIVPSEPDPACHWAARGSRPKSSLPNVL